MPKSFPALLLLLVAVSATSILVDRWIRAPRPETPLQSAPTAASTPSESPADPAHAASETNPSQSATASTEHESARGPTTPALHPQDRAGAAAVAAAVGVDADDGEDEPAALLLRGRVLDWTGGVAAGAEIAVRGTGSGPRWQVRERAGGDGRFECELPADARNGLVVELSDGGPSRIERRWATTPTQPVLDVGEWTLPGGTRVSGHLMDALRNPPGDGWSVHIVPNAASADDDSGATIRYRPIDVAADGGFESYGLPPGDYEFSAAFGSLARTDPVRVQLVEGEAREVQLVHRERDPRRRLDLQLKAGFLPAEHIFGVGRIALAPGSVLLEGKAGDLDLVAGDGGIDRAILEDLDPGTYTLVFNDPRFDPLRIEGLTTGRSWSLTTRGRGVLRVRVHVAGDQVDVEDVDSWIQLGFQADAGRQPAGQTFIRVRDNGVLEGLPPVPLRLRVRRPGYREVDVSLEPIEPGEERSADVELVGLTHLRARVVAEGQPETDTMVAVVPAPKTKRSDFWPRPRESSGRTNSEGQAEFSGLPSGDYEVLAWDETGRVATASHVALPVEGTVDVELDLGPQAHVRVRVLGADEAVLGNFRVEAQRTIADNPSVAKLAFGRLAGSARFPLWHSSAEAEGNRFALGPIGPGTLSLYLKAEGVSGTPLGTVTLAPGETRELEFDLTETFPGSAELTVAVDGVPAADAIVHLVHRDPRRRAKASADSRGVVRFEGLGAGRWWPVIESAAAEARWGVSVEPALDVSNSERVEATYALTTTAGVLRLVDREGVPLAGLECTVLPRPEWNHPARLRGYQTHRTDSAGDLNLTLPGGEYVLLVGPRDSEAAEHGRPDLPRLTWPPAITPPVLIMDRP